MNILKPLLSAKKIAIFLLVAVLAITLMACEDQSSYVPYGSISDETYLAIDDYSVTKRELYDQMRTTSASRLSDLIEKIVFSDVELDLGDLSDFEVESFEREINNALFSNSNITAKQISEMLDNVLAQRILSFVDSFAITHPDTDKDLMIAYFEAVIEDVIERANAVDFDEEADFVFGYLSFPGFTSTIAALVDQYTVSVQKRVYAKEILGDIEDGELTGELADEDSTVHINEQNLVTYYNNNIKGRYEVNALVIEFASVREHEIARYKYGIKSNSRGEWYMIPHISEQSVIDAIKADDYAANSSLGKAKKILTDSLSDGGLGLNLADLEPIDYRTPEFATYYSKYALNSAVDANIYARILDDSAELNEVLYYFLKIYDDLHSTNFAPADIADLASGEAYRDLLEEEFTFKYTDNLFSGNTSLRNYVYGLDKEALYYETLDGPNEDDKTFTRPYSRQVQTFNNKNYLVYLMNDTREKDEDILDDTNSDNIIFQDNAQAQEARSEALRKLVDQRLTTTYINNKVSEKYEEATIDIYDPILREFYRQNRDYSGSEGFKNDNVLATVNGVDITVDEYFDNLDEVLGVSTALDLIFMQKLSTTYGDEITDEDYQEFREQFETQYVNPFLANQYATAGFPADMGLEKFLLLGFGAWAHDGRSATQDALDKIYVQTKLRTLFEEDLQNHFPGDTEDHNIYTKFAELANTFKTHSIGINASHLLIYLDLNSDGQPDDPNEIDFASANLVDLNNDPIETIEDLDLVIAEFLTLINERAALSTTMSEGLNRVVTAYNNATRYELSTMSIADLAPNPTPEEIQEFLEKYNREDIWVPFKRIGFALKYESLGEITNQQNFPGKTPFDEDFLTYALALANHLKQEVTENDIEPNEILPLYGPNLGDSVHDDGAANFSIEKARSGFGWHLILVTGYSKPTSALVEGDEETYESHVVNPFDEDEKLSALNDTDDLTWQQILIYLEESKEETGVVTLPTDVITSINKYFSPIQTAYVNSYSKLEIAFRFTFGGEVKLDDAQMDAKLQVLRTANLNQFFNYSYFPQADGSDSIYDRATNPEYAKVYQGWYDLLGAAE